MLYLKKHTSLQTQHHSSEAIGQFNKNLAIANRSRVSCAHNTPRAFTGLNITPWPWNLG